VCFRESIAVHKMQPYAGNIPWAVSKERTAKSCSEWMTAYSEVTSCSTTRNWLTPSGEISTVKSACVQVFRTELDWLIGMSHGRLSGPFRQALQYAIRC
jgi:hypothetical protein